MRGAPGHSERGTGGERGQRREGGGGVSGPVGTVSLAPPLSASQGARPSSDCLFSFLPTGASVSCHSRVDSGRAWRHRCSLLYEQMVSDATSNEGTSTNLGSSILMFIHSVTNTETGQQSSASNRARSRKALPERTLPKAAAGPSFSPARSPEDHNPLFFLRPLGGATLISASAGISPRPPHSPPQADGRAHPSPIHKREQQGLEGSDQPTK